MGNLFLLGMSVSPSLANWRETFSGVFKRSFILVFVCFNPGQWKTTPIWSTFSDCFRVMSSIGSWFEWFLHIRYCSFRGWYLTGIGRAVVWTFEVDARSSFCPCFFFYHHEQGHLSPITTAIIFHSSLRSQVFTA